MKQLLPLFMILALLISCQSEKGDQITYTANFYLRYLADGQEIKAQATFLTIDSAGQQQQTTMPGGVSFQGSGMGQRDLGNGLIRYQYENVGQFPEDFRFGCRLTPQDPWAEFSHSMIPIRRFKLDDSVQSGTGATLLLPDGPLTTEEQLVLIFNNSENQATSIEIKGPSEGNAIRLSPGQLSTLQPGLYQYYLVKKGLNTQTVDGITARLETEYYSSAETLTILSPEGK
jgi:hypothetical protein